MITIEELKPTFDAMWEGHRSATEGYNELHHLAHNLRAVGMSELAAKIDAMKEKFDPQHCATVKLFNQIRELYE